MIIIIKKIDQYFKNHTWYSATIHITTGIGLGMLLTYPLAGPHPVRWGVTFLAIGILGHLYPLMRK